MTRRVLLLAARSRRFYVRLLRLVVSLRRMFGLAAKHALLQITNLGPCSIQLATQCRFAKRVLLNLLLMTGFNLLNAGKRSLMRRLPIPGIPNELGMLLFGQRYQHLRKRR